MVPGQCTYKAHDRANLGLGGRRVLVSRKWSGKTLADHKADRAAVVRAVLEEAGIDPDDHDELSVMGTDGRWSWELLGRSRVDEQTYTAAIAAAITTRERWRTQYETAKEHTRPGRGRRHPGRGVSSAVRQRHQRRRGTVDGPGDDHREQLLLRPTEAAARLGIGRTKVYELMRSGELRSVKIGGARRVSATALVDFVARLDAA